ncbi:MAG: hypothetical protein ABIH85_01035 [Candidatus Omnitrophota bacterium]
MVLSRYNGKAPVPVRYLCRVACPASGNKYVEDRYACAVTCRVWSIMAYDI